MTPTCSLPHQVPRRAAYTGISYKTKWKGLPPLCRACYRWIARRESRHKEDALAALSARRAYMLTPPAARVFASSGTGIDHAGVASAPLKK